MGRLIDAWRLLNAPCRAMARLASAELDRPLDRIERIALRSHRLYCAPCRRYARQILALGRALRGDAGLTEVDDSSPGLSLPDDVRERIKRRMREG